MNRYSIYRISTAVALGASVLVAACAKEAKQTEAPGEEKKAESGPTVAPTGRIITVEAYSDEAGNYFKPKEFEAHRGDVVRFVLKSGVHNVNFLPDSNPGAKYLPATSDMLQLPGQTYDVVISMGEGKYYFQCDPHALLGMVGRIKVED